MKHQVFLFLSILSFFSVHAMKKDVSFRQGFSWQAVNNVTNVQIADALSTYCSVYPDLVNTENAKKIIQLVRTYPLTFEEKTAILEQMKNFPQPYNVCIIGKKAVLLERESNESKSTIDSIC